MPAKIHWLTRIGRLWTQFAVGLAIFWMVLSFGLMFPIAIAELAARLLAPILGSIPAHVLAYAGTLFCDAFLIYMVISLVRDSLQKRREARRAEQGLCRKCGYDVRENAERCPECGTMIRREPTPNMPGWD